MDPNRAADEDGRSQVPRTCGDRPHLRPAACASSRDSPHMRGSTALETRRMRLVEGFPARAGIDQR